MNIWDPILTFLARRKTGFLALAISLVLVGLFSKELLGAFHIEFVLPVEYRASFLAVGLVLCVFFLLEWTSCLWTWGCSFVHKRKILKTEKTRALSYLRNPDAMKLQEIAILVYYKKYAGQNFISEQKTGDSAVSRLETMGLISVQNSRGTGGWEYRFPDFIWNSCELDKLEKRYFEQFDKETLKKMCKPETYRSDT